MFENQNKVVGLKQTNRALAEGTAAKVIIARDADKKLAAPVIEKCEQDGIEVEFAESKAVLGERAGIDVAAAFITILL